MFRVVTISSGVAGSRAALYVTSRKVGVQPSVGFDVAETGRSCPAAASLRPPYQSKGPGVQV
jgi:hypothetical protein